LGHQNHKQKIKYLVQIKEENVKCKEHISKIELENSKLRRAVKKYETEMSAAR
jgi:hypothetical protein